jgi:hypothetical protein
MFGTALVMGLGATLLMDAWNLFLKRGFGIPSLDYGLLGRWVLHMTSGRFAHPSIARAPAQRFERPVGYLAHYSIGVAFAVAFVAVAPVGWTRAPSPGPAVLFGIATVVIPFFVMQPALGLGIASAKTPSPARARLKSLATHTVFGVGLYLAALAARAAPGF